jgi:cytochrome c2
VTLAQLKAKLKPTELTVEDPVFKAKKTYVGFKIAEILELLAISPDAGDEILFHCADGYAPELSLSRLNEKQGILAFEEKGRKDRFEKVKQGKALLSPAPFYLVWQSTDPAFPWPYQVVALEVVSFAKKFDRLFPAGVGKGTAPHKGFTVFKNHCLKCHSINLQGGDLGPELNIPRSITEYRDETFLRAFIRNPEEFRARSKMPGNPKLTDPELDSLMAYLQLMRDRKK